MAKVGGSYDSVVLGVSQQTPQDRRSGQMWEQVNMISDPVQGLTRRQGSQFIASQKLATTRFPDDLKLRKTAVKYKVRAFSMNGKDYDLIYADEPVRTDAPNFLPCYAYCKTDKKFLAVAGSGPIWGKIVSDGITAVVNIGQYLFISAKGWVPTYTSTTTYDADSARKDIAIWVRNGDYSRDYSVTLTPTSGNTFTATYKTPSSAYSGRLDTSGIPVPTMNITDQTTQDEINRLVARFNSQMADYNKRVADATNNYNSAVTQHIAAASAAIQPEAIAIELTTQIRTLGGLSAAQVQRAGSYIYITKSANIRTGETIAVADTYIKAVFNDVAAPEDLIPKHFFGKVVKVRSKKANGKDAYYLRAESRDGSTGQYGDVVWREGAGTATAPNQVFALGTVVGDTLYIASTPAELAAASGASDVPRFIASAVGDQTSVPVPNFLKNPITYMGVFQDRLLIGYGSTIFASRPGDYFNWFKQSVLDVLDNDPVEMYALGSEDDTIHWDTTFDRNHVMFGRKYQYIINGRSLLTPKNPNIQIMSAIEDAVEAEPQASSNLVFYGKDLIRKGALHQMQLGLTSDSAESYECSQQLDRYIKGKPVQILCNQSPYVVMVRSSEMYNGFYLYTYLDSMNGGQRMFDSWSRWEWDTRLGYCCGLSKYQGEIISYTFRTHSGGTWIIADKFTFDTELSDYPYMDSWMPMTQFQATPDWMQAATYSSGLQVAYTVAHDYFLLGSPYPSLETNMPWWRDDAGYLNIGLGYEAMVMPTSPYRRDQNDKPILNGRLTVSSLGVSVTDTGALDGVLELPDRTVQLPGFDGRILTRLTNVIGAQPLVETTIKVPVYKEIREYKLKLLARSWLPLTITGIEWVGQWFGRVRRV